MMYRYKRVLSVVCVLCLSVACLSACGSSGKDEGKQAQTEEKKEIDMSDIGGRDYSSLPDIMTMEDGTEVTTKEQYEKRRQEMLELLSKYIYGDVPTDGYKADYEVVEEGEAFDGKAVRKQIKMTITTDKGSHDTLMLLYLPKENEKSAVIIGLNGKGNTGVGDDAAVLPSYYKPADQSQEELSGAEASKWNVGAMIDRGYGLCTMYSDDLTPDGENYADGISGLFDETRVKALSAWAFGISRAVDYLETEPAVDADRLALFGHSRRGKAALWASANDDRIALTISNCSGTVGASMARQNPGEPISVITGFFPQWVVGDLEAYNEDVDKMPVDQHMLLACIAPRKLYVASADEDEWADPQGAWNSLMFTRPAYELYGQETIADDVLQSGQTMPEVEKRVFSECMAFHMRSGAHDVTDYDWGNYMDYMDEYLK